MLTVSGMDSLHAGFVAIASRVERRAAEGFGEIGGEAFVVVGVKSLLEGVGGHRISQTEFMPSLREGEDSVEASELFVKGRHGDNSTFSLYVNRMEL